ncbi:MAG: c-type cytochrome, partial [Gammaproteobacteria bacterium]
VIDRATGKLISAEKIGKVTWASHVDPATGRPVEVPGSRYEDGEELVWPSPIGVHSWHAMSFNPQTGLAYLPTIELPFQFTDKDYRPKEWQSPSYEIDPGVQFSPGTEVTEKLDAGFLLAWDPVRKKEAWRLPLPGVWNPGTMTTAGGLVFAGRADGRFVAYRATDGEVLWTFDTKVGISAPPVTYEVDGTQYVSLLVGWGGGGSSVMGSVTAQHGWTYGVHPRRLLTFALDAKATLPDTPPPQVVTPLVAEDFKIDPQLAASGNALFTRKCVLCHGTGAVAGGYAPDLRASQVPLYLDALRDVVADGSRAARGMPRYQEFTDKDLESLQHYIRQQARRDAQKAAAQ